MDRATARGLGIQVEAALKAVAEKNGLTFKYTGGTFDPDGTFRPRGEFREAGADAAQFARFASEFGLDESFLGREFDYRGIHYKVIGINPKKWKQPVILSTSTGRNASGSPEFVKSLLGVVGGGK